MTAEEHAGAFVEGIMFVLDGPESGWWAINLGRGIRDAAIASIAHDRGWDDAADNSCGCFRSARIV